MINSNGQVAHWKPGQNYRLDVLAARGTRVLVSETWDDGPRHVEVDAHEPETSIQTATTQAAAPAAAAPPPEPAAAKPTPAAGKSVIQQEVTNTL